MFFSNQYISRLYAFEFLLLAFAIPIYQKVVPYIIVAMVITWLMEADFVNKSKRIIQDRNRLHVLLFGSIYVIHGIGLLYTDNFGYGYFDMEVKMSLFIFPVLMATLPSGLFTADMGRRVLFAFVFGVLTSLLMCYSHAIYQYTQQHKLQVFYYSELSPLIHTSYLAMYAGFAVAVLMYFLERGVIRGRANIILSIVVLVLFVIFIIMLSSKAGILGLLIVFGLYGLYVLLIERKIFKTLFMSVVLAGSFIFLFLVFPYSSERFQQSRSDFEMTGINAEEVTRGTGERMLIWWYSFEITNDNFLMGVGTGDVKDHLLSKYEEKEMAHARELALNAHNQYLQIFIALGITGLLVWLLSLVLPILISLDNRHYLYLAFLLLIAFNFLFESMLETQAGVVFYAFFNAYLFAIKKDPASSEAGS